MSPGEPPPRRPTFIEQARRAQIVQAAIETIAEVGYANATFARIASRAGISPGLISYHFAGKAELVTQIVADIEASMDRAILAVAEGEGSYPAALRAVIETQVRYFAAHTAEVLALGEIFTHARHDPGVGDLAEASRRGSLAEIEDMLREGQEHGELGEFSPRLMAVTLLAALEAVPGELLAHPDADVDEHARGLADIFEAATRPKRSGRRT